MQFTAVMKKVSARNVDGMLIFTGLLRQDSSQESTQSKSDSLNEASINGTSRPQRSARKVPSVALSFVDSRSASPEIDNDDGPNANGTYSREYTLKHPNIQWVHRGQGRYRPDIAVSGNINDKSPTSSQEQDLLFPEVRKSLRTRHSSASEGDNHDIHLDARRLSPRASRVSETSYTLRRRQSDQSSQSAESREVRLNRRSNVSNTPGESQAMATIDEDDNSKTFVKSYVEAHPEMHFRHCGNGFYKRVTSFIAGGSRSNSSRSLKSETSPIDTLPQTFHSSELKHYPGEKFRHCGNGYYRRESAISQNTSTGSATVTDRSISPFDDDAMTKFNKQEALEYKRLHPEANLVHRGNGVWRLQEDIIVDAARAAAADPESQKTYDETYKNEHPEWVWHHAGYGRYKKGVKPAQPSNITYDEEGREMSAGLVNKMYKDDHPELQFDHKGAGRYALKTASSTQATTRPALNDESRLHDVAYVDAHPLDTFHHRGQGRWAFGSPPPGSSIKMAVRGPGALAHKARQAAARQAAQSAERPRETVASTGPPGPDLIVTRADGPVTWPRYIWDYRGNGTWSLQEGQLLEAGAGDPVVPSLSQTRRTRASRDSIGGVDGSEDASGADAPPALKRKHSALADVNEDEDVQSKDSTPRLKMLTLEEDPLTDQDFPPLYLDRWPALARDEDDDEAAQIVRQSYYPLNDTDAFISALTKHDPSARPDENLYELAEYMQSIIQQLQDEYLELDKITAPHARIPRRLATGGRLPVDTQLFEDRKEADLYNYHFDPKKVGFQNPEVQKITRDIDGRELRKRRRRGELDVESIAAVDDAPLPRRVVKPVNRFDGTPGSTTRPSRLTDIGRQGSATATRIATPERVRPAVNPQNWAETYVPPKSGRWAGHVPKRVLELKGNNHAQRYEDLPDDSGVSTSDDDQSKASPIKTSNVMYSIEEDEMAASSAEPINEGMD